MKFSLSPLIFLGVGVNSLVLLFVASNTISARLSSKNQLSARQQGLVKVANNYMADSCWVSRQEQPYKIGDAVETDGTLLGKLPTSCIKSVKTRQLLHVMYLDGRLQVIHVFTPTELQNQISAIKKEQKND
jgi:hypothetical protein